MDVQFARASFFLRRKGEKGNYSRHVLHTVPMPRCLRHALFSQQGKNVRVPTQRQEPPPPSLSHSRIYPPFLTNIGIVYSGHHNHFIFLSLPNAQNLKKAIINMSPTPTGIYPNKIIQLIKYLQGSHLSLPLKFSPPPLLDGLWEKLIHDGQHVLRG